MKANRNSACGKPHPAIYHRRALRQAQGRRCHTTSGAALIAALLALVFAASCGKSPKAVFADLQDAAVKKDAKAIWAGLTPETKLALIAHSKDVFKGPGGTVRAAPTEVQGREYLAMLTANLESLSIEYIKTLRASTITVKDGTAEIIPTSFRFGSPGKTVKLVKVNGKWLWDAREILEWYLEERSEISNLSQGGL